MMELYREILENILKQQKIEVSFPELTIDAAEIINLECYKALSQIKDVIYDDTLEDRECFQKIEEIICILESHGILGSTRHDFI